MPNQLLPNAFQQPSQPSGPAGSQFNPNIVQGPQPIDPSSDNSGLGLVKSKPEEKSEVEKTLEGLDETKIDYLGRKVIEEFSTARTARYIQEQTWIRCHQNDKGIYSSDTDFDSTSSRAFVQITRPKVMNAHARLVEVCLPSGEDAWSIDPSPKPFIPEVITKMLAAGASPEAIQKAVQIAAEKASDSMSCKIKDGLSETNWSAKLQESLLHMCLYGTSIMAGPFAVPSDEDMDASERNVHQQLKSRLSQMSSLFDSGMSDEYRPEMEVVYPFHFYPDPGATRIEDCGHVIIRRVVNKSQLLDLAKREGFREDTVHEVIEATPTGNWSAETWESVINITNSQQMMSMPNGRFVILQRWGFLSGEDIKNAGIPIKDSQLHEQVMCQLWVSGGRVISLQVSKMFRTRLPFYVTPYCLVPHSIWGSGPAEFMMDSQDGINACERAKYDSMALSSRPQVSINVSRLAHGQDALEIKAGRIWATTDSPISQGKPVEFFYPPSIVAEVQKVQQDAMAFCDEQTGLPRSLQGEGGPGVHNRTASGASMQFNSAITPLKGVAFNIDNKLVSPMLRNMVKFFTEFSKDKSIVGDFQINAKGVSGLMAREVASQKIMQLMATAAQNEQFSSRIDMSRVFDLLMRGSGLQDSKLIYTEDEMQKRQEQQQQQQQVSQAAGAQLQANIQGDAHAKMRAETSPRDVVLQAMEAVPDSCIKLKLTLIKQVLVMSGAMTPEVDQALGHEDDKQTMIDQDMAHQLGSEASIRENGPSDLHKLNHAASIKESDREHQSNMKKLDQEHQVKLAGMKVKESVRATE